MHRQKTIENIFTCSSVGLHSGRKVTMTVKPAEADQGITFVRTDIPGGCPIEAHAHNVSDTTLATTLGTNGTRISTVEHLLSALFGMGVDNATVEVDSFEIPIMDGSAQPFVTMIKDSGVVKQDTARSFVVITRPVTVTDGEGTATLRPARQFAIDYAIDFPHPFVGKQHYSMVFSPSAYEADISYARTFGFLHEVEYLQAKGLALGGSLNNAIVLDEKKVINKDGLRCPREFVKHKILDAVGDLSLLGKPIIGHLDAYKSGHRLNNLLLRKVLAEPDCYETVSFTDTFDYASMSTADDPSPLFSYDGCPGRQ